MSWFRVNQSFPLSLWVVHNLSSGHLNGWDWWIMQSYVDVATGNREIANKGSNSLAQCFLFPFLFWLFSPLIHITILLSFPSLYSPSPYIPFLSPAPCPSDPKISTLTPNGHLDLSSLPAGLFPGERLTFALGSRKNSAISLGRANLEQRAVVSGNGCNERGRKTQSCWAVCPLLVEWLVITFWCDRNCVTEMLQVISL